MKSKLPADRHIHLTHGKVALVSPEDYARFKHRRWYLQSGDGGRQYAACAIRENGKKRTVLLQREILGPLRRLDWTLFLNGDTLDCRRENIMAIRCRKVIRRLG